MTDLPFSNLVLVGFMGSGKSSVGRLLATQLGFQFVDTDSLVVQATGMQISDLFGQFGEEFFREREAEALHSLVGRHGLIIATGGGIVTRECNLPVLRSIGVIIGLTASEEVIFERVSRNNKRPLLHTPNPRETISQLLSLRGPLYEAAADFTVDTSHRTHAEVAHVILQHARGAVAQED